MVSYLVGAIYIYNIWNHIHINETSTELIAIMILYYRRVLLFNH